MGRTIALALALVLSFAAVVGIMLKVMNPPLKDSDYLVIGSVATLVSLLTLFVLVAVTSGRGASIFFKRRKKGS